MNSQLDIDLDEVALYEVRRWGEDWVLFRDSSRVKWLSNLNRVVAVKRASTVARESEPSILLVWDTRGDRITMRRNYPSELSGVDLNELEEFQR